MKVGVDLSEECVSRLKGYLAENKAFKKGSQSLFIEKAIRQAIKDKQLFFQKENPEKNIQNETEEIVSV